MSTYSVASSLQASEDYVRLEEFLDGAVHELEALGSITDAGYMASTEGAVTFEGFLEADGLQDAHEAFITAVRTAIHAAGGGTPGWDLAPAASRWSSKAR